MCNQDWVNFFAPVGSSVRVETSALQGGADTQITAWKGGFNGCFNFVATDDNSGAGLASKLELTGTGERVAVLVEDTSGVYNPAKGYDITVTCLSSCSCSAQDGLNFELSRGSVTGPEVYEARAVSCSPGESRPCTPPAPWFWPPAGQWL